MEIWLNNHFPCKDLVEHHPNDPPSIYFNGWRFQVAGGRFKKVPRFAKRRICESPRGPFFSGKTQEFCLKKWCSPIITLPKTNITPGNWWLEVGRWHFLLGWPIFQGQNVSFRECMWRICLNHENLRCFTPAAPFCQPKLRNDGPIRFPWLKLVVTPFQDSAQAPQKAALQDGVGKRVAKNPGTRTSDHSLPCSWFFSHVFVGPVVQ